MAGDISITAANVKQYRGGQLRRAAETAEALTAGDTVVRLKTDGLWYKGESGVESDSAVRGICAETSVDIGQPFTYWAKGEIEIGGTTTKGKMYYQSANNGKITDTVPTTGLWVTPIGIGTGNGRLLINIFRSGIQVP